VDVFLDAGKEGTAIHFFEHQVEPETRKTYIQNTRSPTFATPNIIHSLHVGKRDFKLLVIKSGGGGGGGSNG
jgi:hypothetical protein